MKNMTLTFRQVILPFVVVHTVIVGLFAGMAYLTVELFFPISWAPILY